MNVNIISREDIPASAPGVFPPVIHSWRFKISYLDAQTILSNPTLLEVTTSGGTILVNDIYIASFPNPFGFVWLVYEEDGFWYLGLTITPDTAFFITYEIDDLSFGLELNPISTFFENPFSSGLLFYTKDLDFIKFTSLTTGSYVQITVAIVIYTYKDFTPLNYVRTFKVPFYNSKCDFHVGSIIHQLFEEISGLNQALTSDNSNFQSEYLKPAEILISTQEYKFDNSSDPSLQGGILPLFYMIKGRKNYTSSNNLSLLTIQQQEISRITKSSVIGFSFTHDTVPNIILKRNNIIVENILLTKNPPTNKIYSYYRFINDFQIGDFIELIVVDSPQQFRAHRYLVFHDGLNSLQLFFENDNGVIEPYEFTGRILGNVGYKSINKTEFKDLYETESKEISNSTEILTINPGKILKSDIKIIDKIIKSKNVWINLNGEFLKIDAITNKLPVFDSESNELITNIEFNILENTNAEIYL